MSLMQSAPLCVARGRYMRRVPKGPEREGRTASSAFIFNCGFFWVSVRLGLGVESLGVGVFHISGTTCRSCSWRPERKSRGGDKDSEISIKEIRKSVDKVTSLGWRCLLG